MRNYRKLIGGILLTSAVVLAPQQHADAFDWKGIVSSATDYMKQKEQLNYLNTEGSDQVNQQIRTQCGVDNDPAKNEQLARVMTKLTNAIAAKEKISPQYKYFVNPKKEFNAFCTLGHNVSVNSGLFDTLQNDEDEIGFVLAHELVHGQKNHGVNQADKLVPLNILKGVVAQKTGAQAGEIAGKYLVAKQATLPGEWEADNVGFIYATDAGYNPGAGAAIWSRILERYGDNCKNFFGEIQDPNDHPTNKQRVNNYAKKLAEYGKGKVAYNAETSYVMVNNKAWFKVARTDSRSANERGYLIAGKLARMFHNGVPARATAAEGDVMVGSYQIATPNGNEQDAQSAAQALNAALGL